MAKYFNLNLEDGNILRIGFGQQAQNDEIVRDVVASLEDLKKSGELAGGPLILVNGPASLPVAMALCHGLCHLYEVVGVFDPKLGKYVVAISHGNNYQVGDLI